MDRIDIDELIDRQLAQGELPRPKLMVWGGRARTLEAEINSWVDDD